MYYSYSGNSIYYDEEDQYTKIEYEELETSEYINNVATYEEIDCEGEWNDDRVFIYNYSKKEYDDLKNKYYSYHGVEVKKRLLFKHMKLSKRYFEPRQLNIKELTKEEIINEVWYRIANKDYLVDAKIDDLDYLCMFIKSNMNKNSIILKSNGDGNGVTSRAYVFREYIWYNDSKWFNKAIIWLEDYYRVLNIKEFYRPKHENCISYFFRIISSKKCVEVILNSDLSPDNFECMLYLYKYYLEYCKSETEDQINEYEVFVKGILSKALNNVDWNLHTHAIIKYLNKFCSWRFLNLLRKSNKHYNYTVRSIKQKSGSDTVGNTTEFILKYWFGLNISTLEELQELNLKDKDKQFICNICKSSKGCGFNKNKNGEWDIRKQDLCKNMNITYDSMKGKVKRIKNKVKELGLSEEIKFKQIEHKYKPKFLNKKWKRKEFKRDELIFKDDDEFIYI